jgi:regulator of protease activity HflC (stomatin/prohibitin superfamily)
MLDNALGWIGQVVEWIGRFITRGEIVNPVHGALKFVGGSKVVKLGPGIHWYWPARTEFHTYPVARQAVDLRAQTFVTEDDKTIAAGGLIVYEIEDLEAILAHTYDPDETIRDITLSAIHDVCCRLSWADLKSQQQRGTLDTKLRNEARRGLDGYGVRVLKVTLTDLAPCRVVKLLQSQQKQGA